ncbi:MAG: ATP synthase F1 subunit delta [Planctomycetes bacterium]|nr:ATP synthase F1 subunit delta [Planctomycetota bacterium]
MRDLPLARKYAAAIFDLAVKRQALQPTLEGLENLSAAVTSDERVFSFFACPTIPVQDKARIFGEVSRTLGVSEDCNGLCQVMIANGRMAMLPDVVAAVRKRVADFEGRAEAWVTTARELCPEEQQRLQSALMGLSGKSVSLRVEVNPSIIGGVIVRIENTVIDGSVVGRLRVFAEQME